MNRRQFIFGGLVASSALGFGGYAYHRGVRVPPFHLEPRSAIENNIQIGSTTMRSQHLLPLPDTNSEQSHWRMLAPQASLEVTCAKRTTLELSFSNVSLKAKLQVQNADVEYQGAGTHQLVKLNIEAGKSAILQWRWPSTEQFRFAAIGDSGGDQELKWCIDRAHQLGADFLLHLGDFNYQAGDYERAVNYFNTAPLPVYVSIGNHDFHENGGVYRRFLNEIGPQNSYFDLGGFRFLNLDTAAGFFPLSGGNRGRLFTELNQQQPRNTIAFTHCPLVDPASLDTPDQATDHDVGSERERRWLAEQLRGIGALTLLCGHIHIRDRRSVRGLDQIIVGQGLGHQDLIVGADHSKIAIGEVDAQGTLAIEMDDLAMPMNQHCHPRTDPVKKSLRGGEHDALIQSVERACSEKPVAKSL